MGSGRKYVPLRTFLTTWPSRTLTSPHLPHISSDTAPLQEAQQVLAAVSAAPGHTDHTGNPIRWTIDPQIYLDSMDEWMDGLAPEGRVYKESLLELGELCRICEILPSSHLMSSGLTLVMDGIFKRPFASSYFSDVWKARNGSWRVFAIKHFRALEFDGLNHVKKEWYKEVINHRRIKHENVLGIEGIAPGMFKFCTVSKWMENGNLLQYVRARGQVDRMRLLLGITRGLAHIHSNEMIHGNLRSANVLIDEKGKPLLADFFLSSITRDAASVSASVPHGAIRWESPELLDPVSYDLKNQTPTTKSDIYALSMDIIELGGFSSHQPEYSFPRLSCTLGAFLSPTCETRLSFLW